MAKNIIEYFGYRVREARNQRQLSQEDLADLAGVHRTYIGMIERAEKNITLRNIEKIALALNLTISELFDGYENDQVLTKASEALYQLKNTPLDILTVTRPPDLQYANHLAKVVSKLSPIVGNMIEFAIVSQLNALGGWYHDGYWLRQDPGFPDAILDCIGNKMIVK